MRYKIIVRDNDQDYGREYGYTNRRHALRDAARIVREGYKDAAQSAVYEADADAPLARWINVGGRAVKVNV